MAVISPQRTGAGEPFLESICTYDSNSLTCILPEFKDFLSPAQLRRLSRMMRIGLTAAIQSLGDAGIEKPDGIITSTGYGFLEETEKFLTELLERQERQLTPTFFIQGTYNALSGLIGLATHCQGYNTTHVSKGSAFENALLDAMLQLAELPAHNFLVGSYDEVVGVLRSIGMREGYLRKDVINNTVLFQSPPNGTIQGEGAAFFSLSQAPGKNCWCRLADLHQMYRPPGAEVSASLEAFLTRNNVNAGQVDTWVSGASGNADGDMILESLGRGMLQDVPQVRFKHLCGEYCTALSFGMWLGARMLREQVVPEAIRIVPFKAPPKLERILIVNHYLNRNYAFVLLEHPEKNVGA
jgi:3-oxoacyl-(acyl-carrier-protein) synthase